MGLSYRENFLLNASMRGHEWIPAAVAISKASWMADTAGLEAVCRKYPQLFPHFRIPDLPPAAPQGRRRSWVDDWSCRWEAEIEGLQGVVVGPPLADWSNLRTWKPPQPPAFDEATRTRIAKNRAAGGLIASHIEHGFFFMRLFYLRGFDNFMADVAGQDPRLDELAEIITGHYERWLAPRVREGLDLLACGDDLGTQTASFLGPRHFRRWVLPAYQRIFRPARQAGAHVQLHSDGYIMDILEELLEAGVTILNPQDRVNGVDALASRLKGRACIALDVDRQQVLPFGSPADVRELIREEVLKLGSPAGGLQFVAGIYPPTPARNVDALCAAILEFRTYWVGR